MERRTRGAAAAGAVAAAHLAGTGLLAWASAGVLAEVRAPGPAQLDAGVGVAAAVAAWALLTWLAGTTLLALAAEALRGTRPRLQRLVDLVTPALVRRAAAAALGASLVGGVLATAASAAGRPAPWESQVRAIRPAATATAAASTTDTVLPALDRPADPLPGWTPDRPASPRTAREPARVHLVTTVPHLGRSVADEVVVRRGDTLWDIASRHLGPDAGAAELALEWPRWHRANRDVIGPEPDLIRPGQRLRPPAG